MTDWDRPVRDLLEEKDTESDSESDADVTCETVPQVMSLQEARECVEKLKLFAASNGNTKLLNSVMDMSSSLTELNIQTMTVQKKISDFFK